MSKTLLLLGGGHAHMTVMSTLGDSLRRGFQVKLVNPDPYQYYSGMGPGLLGGIYRPQEVRFHVRKMVEDGGGEFIRGRGFRIDADEKWVELDDGRRVGYDVLSCNTGSGVPFPSPANPAHVTAVKPIAGLWPLRNTLKEKMQRSFVTFLVVGGGPAGVEIAGNLHALIATSGGTGSVVLAAGRGGLLAGLPSSMRHRAAAHLKRQGIVLLNEGRVHTLAEQVASFESGKELLFDHAVVATGVEPSVLYHRSGLALESSPGLAVNRFLQSVVAPDIFGGGDCLHFTPCPLAKVGVYAVRQNPVLHHNLLARLEGRPLQPFKPQRGYLLILNLGGGRGMLKKGPLVLQGKIAFALKDWIDRRFMRTYQRSGELND